MNRSLPIHWISALCCLYLSAIVFLNPAITHAAIAPAIASNDTGYMVDNPNLSKGMLDVMQASRAKYIEGSSLIKSGDSSKARESFNRAVDLVLQSDWDIPSTPALNQYFQDLIQRIQEDESRYLVALSDSPEEIENAVVDELDNLDLISGPVDPSIQDALQTVLGKTKYEIPITMNEMVAKSLDYWLNSGRKYFVDGLVRSGQYRPIIERVFREESIPLDLMYLAQVESLFKPHAVSKARARGIWQFEKGTALRYGLKVTRDVDERSDPEKSTRAAARYLNDLFAMFKDWNLALAAYNWGEGKVQRLIDSTGLKDFWQLVDLRRRLPEETKKHVPLIQASVILGRNPEKFGLPTELDPPLKYAEVSVSKPIDLRAAARVLSTSIDELKKLNPAIRGLTTPANYPNFQLKVPVDSDPQTHDKLAALPAAKIRLVDEFDYRHKVKPGDSLTRIAARYHVTATELAKENSISLNKKLTPGTWIKVPSRPVIPNTTLASPRVPSAKLVAGKPTNEKSKPAAAKSGKTARANAARVQNKKPRSEARSTSLKDTIDTKTSQKQITSK
jgi:membrane-bound lytic murein transglycosylase D